MITPEAFASYQAALRGFDWTFEFSDDHSVWKAGRAALAELRAMQAEIDPDGRMWDAYRREHNKGDCPGPRIVQPA